jgi:hypothetical protein
MNDGRSARDALSYALRAVLPFYTLTPTGISTIEVSVKGIIFMYISYVDMYAVMYANIFFHIWIRIYMNLSV